MKKKNLLSLILVVLLVLTLGMGTFAYYTKTFTSAENVVRSANFIVDSKGTLDNNVEFDLTNDPLYPGIKKDVYEFKIDKTGTEVPVEYKLTVSGNDELFSTIDGVASPVVLSILRKSGDTWTTIDNDSTIDPTEDVENFKINLEWNHDNVNDIKFQGKTGKISINVVATQLDKVEEPPVEKSIIATYTKVLIGNPTTGKYSVILKVNAHGFGEDATTYSFNCLLNGKEGSYEGIALGGTRSMGLIFARDQVKLSNVTIKIHDVNGNVLETFNNVNVIPE